MGDILEPLLLVLFAGIGATRENYAFPNGIASP